MRISGWSSDVCSSDLQRLGQRAGRSVPLQERTRARWGLAWNAGSRPSAFLQGSTRDPPRPARDPRAETGRESCRERVCQDVEISVVGVYLRKKQFTTQPKPDDSI